MNTKINKHTVLIIDDDSVIVEVMMEILHLGGYNVLSANNSTDCFNILERNDIDLILLDYKLPAISGMQILKKIKRIKPDQLIIMISGYGSIKNAVEATKSGAYDFLEKPLEPQRVLLTIKNALEKKSLIEEKQSLLEETRSRYKMIGVSAGMHRIFSLIDRIANSQMRVLIQGESGTGKDLVARAIHLNSGRESAPFYSLNCAAIPEELIESELFGHVKGAFTHAISDKNGAFMAANKGTLLLDEIGDLSLRAQAKVLRAIEDGEINLVGGHKVEKVDVRIISATHRNLENMIEYGTFREDLYHRINGVNIYIHPLRERPDDIEPLAKHFLEEACVANNIVQKQLLEEAIILLKGQKWNGNARELRNVIERMMILSDSEIIDGNTVLTTLQLPDLKVEPFISDNFKVARENFEKVFLINKLVANSWNVSKTALTIGMERTHLHRKMKKYNINENIYSDQN